MKSKIEIGKVYGVLQVLSADANYASKYKHYFIKCLKCGKVFSDTGQNIVKHQNSGCIECRKAHKYAKMVDAARQYIGKKSGRLEIVDIIGFRPYCGCNQMFAAVRCDKCGELSEVPLSKVKSEAIFECAKCAREYLKEGSRIVRASAVDGTLITEIDGRREKNKNNTSGHNGVSLCRDGKWIAYINFRRKQYHLGYFDRIEDAAAARKIAEKSIYGDFLKWYAENYAEQWEKIKQRKKEESPG